MEGPATAPRNIMKWLSSRTGRPLASSPDDAGGKSELRRAVCRITSGRMGSSPFDGECHRKHTAPPVRQVSLESLGICGTGEVRVKRCGKSAPPSQ